LTAETRAPQGREALCLAQRRRRERGRRRTRRACAIKTDYPKVASSPKDTLRLRAVVIAGSQKWRRQAPYSSPCWPAFSNEGRPFCWMDFSRTRRRRGPIRSSGTPPKHSHGERGPARPPSLCCTDGPMSATRLRPPHPGADRPYGNRDLFPELHIPLRTALRWFRRGLGEVATRSGMKHGCRRITFASPSSNSVSRCFRQSCGSSSPAPCLRLRAGTLARTKRANKRLSLRAKQLRKAMPLSAAVHVLRLSPARYSAPSSLG
jgi:hypothetical protein